MPELVFVKIGGSVATDKEKEKTLRAQILGDIAQALRHATESADLQLLIGHGGGSFGHFPAMKYEVRNGVHPKWGFDGFQITRGWMEELNGKIRAAFAGKGLRLFPVQPSSCVVTESGRIVSYATDTVEALLKFGKIPVLWGDAVVDRNQGFTIVSTETLFRHLAGVFQPVRVIALTNVPGVYPHGTDTQREDAETLARITPSDFEPLKEEMVRITGVDVTGGMFEKVQKLLDLATVSPRTEIRIVNGFDLQAVSPGLRTGVCKQFVNRQHSVRCDVPLRGPRSARPRCAV